MIQNQPVSFKGGMQDNSVSFKGEKKRKGIFSTIGGAALNVGTTMCAGGAAGAGVGKIASFLPYKPSAEDIEHQFKDMFIKAASSDANPEYLAKEGSNLTSIIDKGRTYAKSSLNISENLKEGSELYTTIKKASDEAFGEPELQDKIKKFLKNISSSIQDADITKENVLKSIETYTEGVAPALEKNGEELQNLSKTFLERIKKVNSAEIKELAESGAKHLRKQTTIGIGIAVGIGVALVLNILNTYGVIGKKPKQAQGQTNAQMPNMQQITPNYQMPTVNTHQG